MSAADEAARLRALADLAAIEANAERDLADAKAAYRADPTPATKADLHAAKKTLVGWRQDRRSDGVTIGGDAVKTEEN